MKLLISAYACEPNRGSEPGAGWEWVRAAALENDVWLMTRANNAPKIGEALRQEPSLKLNLVLMDLPKWARFWKKGSRGMRIYYLFWQVLVWRKGARLHRQIRFDLAHHLTTGFDWLPTGLALIPNLKFVWGPVGGTSRFRWRMWKFLSTKGILRDVLREPVTRAARRLFGNWTARRASLILAQNADVFRRFEALNRTVLQPHVALNLEPVPDRSSRRPDLLVFAGRLVSFKGILIAVATLTHPGCHEMALHIYGEGPDARAIQRLAKRVRVTERVHLMGQRPREEILDALKEATALVFPSLNDSAGWIVAEAMCLGCPVICFEEGGPATLASVSESSRLVGYTKRPDIDFAEAVLSLKTDPTKQEAECHWSRERLPALLRDFYQIAMDS